MIIKDQKVQIVWNGKHKQYYISKGYVFTKLQDTFEVNIDDLLKGSNAKVNVQCDYCGGNYVSGFKGLNKRKTHSCLTCVPSKIREVFQDKYGVDHPMQLEETRKKLSDTWMITLGVPHNMMNKAVKDKATRSIIQSMYENGTAPCSNQQRHIHSLIGGELNYPVDKCSLDIAFPEQMVYLEYDGSGHDLCTKWTPREDFDKRQFKRKMFLQNAGWKLIRIISKRDKLLPDDYFVGVIEFCKNYLIERNHSWIEVNIDLMIVKCSEFEKNIKDL